MARDSFLPVILGGDINAYSLARAFHEQYGIKSLVLSQVKSHMFSDSEILENVIVPHLDTKEHMVPHLIGVAKAHPDHKLLLLACGDWYVRLVVENSEALKSYYILPYIDEALLHQLVSKESFYQICEKHQVPHPKTWYHDTRDPQAFQRLADFDLSFPVVAKPASTADYHYAQFADKKKVYFFDDMASLKEMLSRLQQSSYKNIFLLQEFIPGDDTQMRILTTYSDKTGKVRFAAFGQTLLEDKRPMAIGNPVAIVSRVNEQVVADAIRLLEAVGYTGFANFDIKVDPRTGQHYFFEINTRLGRSNYYVTGSGFNVAPWMVDELIEGKTYEGDVVMADRESLYTVVPKATILEYVKDPELVVEVKRLYREGKVANPIKYPGEPSFVRREIYPHISCLSSTRRFARRLSRRRLGVSRRLARR